ncbi:hypothetical protein E2C01_079390 [Portunus trituberculatus]|uniref:Uncharacterized protein n=1 Tax=Portunus trituberculatus TaxID=210409 RepID=A0A5B7IQ71_PORTR|nr:hypothetical protein [Portunus trituberculatus]
MVNKTTRQWQHTPLTTTTTTTTTAAAATYTQTAGKKVLEIKDWEEEFSTHLDLLFRSLGPRKEGLTKRRVSSSESHNSTSVTPLLHLPVTTNPGLAQGGTGREWERVPLLLAVPTHPGNAAHDTHTHLTVTALPTRRRRRRYASESRPDEAATHWSCRNTHHTTPPPCTTHMKRCIPRAPPPHHLAFQRSASRRRGGVAWRRRRGRRRRGACGYKKSSFCSK